jgi:GMP synthase-like glutamine amidotransferase
MKSPSAYILKHVPNEDAGTIRDYLDQKKIPYESVDLYKGAELPENLGLVRSAVIMGGPMNVYEEEKYPFLKDEDIFIRRLLEKNIPVLGVCLGSQLIAKASGARVMKAPVEEIGWDNIHLTPEALRDPLFSCAGGDRLRVLQWHGDTFDLPKGAVHLAASRAVKNQAFRLKSNVYGLQFHVEVTRAMVEDWFKDRADLEAILEEYDAYRPQLSRITEEFYEKFFSL